MFLTTCCFIAFMFLVAKQQFSLEQTKYGPAKKKMPPTETTLKEVIASNVRSLM